ncbi:hypothetical protein NX774_22025 [Massilia agilis]|uniref:Uncharacterized protein n=1 Tax=Massilia agilis TaxID=1811226 RepID=A0ABT2DH15_9BURK|nr:hypothetical protein [Massilia agilis]MCS0810609.1 hypothetical protein [Massilia agilis]
MLRHHLSAACPSFAALVAPPAALMLVLATLLCAPVGAQPATSPRDQANAMWAGSVGEWGRYGMIEMRADGKVSRLTRYSNGDYLGEIEVAGKVKRLLMTGPQLSPLYFGLSEQELDFGRNPFFMFLEGAAIPLFALHSGFPGGSASLLPTPAEHPIKIGRDTATISAWNAPGTGVVQYRLAGNAQSPKVAGQVSMTRPEPLTQREIDSWGPPQQVNPPKPVARP